MPESSSQASHLGREWIDLIVYMCLLGFFGKDSKYIENDLVFQYKDLLRCLRNANIMNKKKDKFLHQIQKPKMKELWDNKEDENWEKA